MNKYKFDKKLVIAYLTSIIDTIENNLSEYEDRFGQEGVQKRLKSYNDAIEEARKSGNNYKEIVNILTKWT